MIGLPQYDAWALSAPELPAVRCPCGRETDGDELCAACSVAWERDNADAPGPLPWEGAWTPEDALVDPVGTALDCDDEFPALLAARLDAARAHIDATHAAVAS